MRWVKRLKPIKVGSLTKCQYSLFLSFKHRVQRAPFFLRWINVFFSFFLPFPHIDSHFVRWMGMCGYDFFLSLHLPLSFIYYKSPRTPMYRRGCRGVSLSGKETAALMSSGAVAWNTDARAIVSMLLSEAIQWSLSFQHEQNHEPKLAFSNNYWLTLRR